MKKVANLKKMIAVSKLYYEDNLNQDEIAKKMEISVPQVSRIINAAKKEGYVKTYVMDPFSATHDLTKQLISTFNLKDAKIVENRASNKRVTQTNAAQAGAEYLLDIIQTNDIVSFSFSNIISKIPQFLPKVHIENISFVQPNGSLFEHVKGYQYDAIRQTGMKLDANYYYLPAPAMVKDKYVKDTLHADPIIKWIINKAIESNIGFFSVNHPVIDSFLLKNEYISQDEITKIVENGAIGEIFGHYINSKGEINDLELENRVIGMDIKELRSKDYSVCLSTGEHCVDAIYAALQGKYFNVLITDTATARGLIEKNENV